MIIGTAGHIDHGKTTLVKALTGIDTDRLKEEKARGITIDLGFAYKPAADGSVLGFVDVPGHEKLVRNMLAGATGIDHVLLVVAADDGPMPQTREHLAILDLLGLADGVVALTKSDLVSPERLVEAVAEVRALLAQTLLRDADIVPVSAVTGLGLERLERHLAEAAAHLKPDRAPGHFRLAIDRSFSLAGIGTVVTGTAVAGQVAVGDRLVTAPGGKPVRVRGIHAQNREAEGGVAGQRLALHLAGVEKSDVGRGDWIVAEPLHAPTQRLDARLHVLAAEVGSLAHWTPVHLHLGAVEVGARVVLLEGAPIAPGSDALVQLELDRPIGALRGDRYILRDQSALRTIGGGRVIDAFAPLARRRKSQRLGVLHALEQAEPADALRGLLALEPPGGVELGPFMTLWNLLPEAQQALLQAVPHRAVDDGTRRLAFAPGQLERLTSRIGETLGAHHQRTPDSPGMTAEQLQRAITTKPSPRVFALMLRELTAGGSLQRLGPYLRQAGHEAALQGNEQKIWERLKPWIAEGGLHPPKLSELLLRDRSLHRDPVVRLLQKLARTGKLYAVGAEYFVLPQQLCELAVRAQALAEQDAHKRLNVKAYREATGISRHLSMPLVEFFDHIGFTKRDPVGRKIRRDALEMFGTSP